MGRKYATVLGAGCLLLGVLTLFMRSTPDAFPFGDFAVTQVYTLEALRGFLKVGPYSQFGWHHPGPLFFYLLVPFYQLSGHRAIGLTAGALAINLASVIASGLLVLRQSGKPAATATGVALAVFLWRADGLFGSIWNAHIVIVPLAALVISCAALAAGDAAAVPITILVASFVVQTDIALLPCAAAIVGLATAVAVIRRGKTPVRTSPGVRVAVAMGLVVWMPPLLEQIAGAPGNLTLIWRYFAATPHAGQSLRTAFSVWSDVTTEFARMNLSVGWGGAYQSRPFWPAATLAIAQVATLIWAVLRARRTGRLFAAWLCLFCLLASAVSGWSITRIDEIHDYQVFWMSVLGVLTWVAVLATIIPREPRPMSAMALGLIPTAVLLTMAVEALMMARAYALEQRDSDVKRKMAALDVVDYIARQHVQRPLFHIAQGTWNDATCVILQAYKHHKNLAVDRPAIAVFGEALAPNGREDVEIFVVDRAEHERLVAGGNDHVVAEHDGLFVHVRGRTFGR